MKFLSKSTYKPAIWIRTMHDCRDSRDLFGATPFLQKSKGRIPRSTMRTTYRVLPHFEKRKGKNNQNPSRKDGFREAFITALPPAFALTTWASFMIMTVFNGLFTFVAVFCIAKRSTRSFVYHFAGSTTETTLMSCWLMG